jgi:catechol 2,3-dioxygenase-like lactoylglutathione lyase family enzyme
VIAHASLHVSNYQKSKAFYVAALAPLGYRNNMESEESAGFNDGKNTDFWISKETEVTPAHLAFETDSRSKVEAFHKAALSAGAKDNGGPGYRDYSPGYYAAFVLDPDGNNIEAVWYDPSKEGQ